ncbi:MAG TPA: hypothetical protein VKH40_05920 [Alloacidobacterium sp.]|nr:hypothetical protein [Alloacidobacterium sp.]
MTETATYMRRVLALLVLLTLVTGTYAQEPRSGSWRVATEAELKALIPPRAPVIQERIETELRTASGITDGKGKYVAGVVLITAGYSAEGKYSHYFIAQVPVKVGDVQLNAGDYLIGWKHNEDSLTVNFYEAASGKFLGSVEAVRNASITRVESFRIWPPNDKSLIQVGRFTFPYQIVG